MATSGCLEPPVRSALSFNTFRENITTSRQTSSEEHSIRRGRSAFWVYAEKPCCEILNLLKITHKKMNMGLYGKICLSDTQFLQNEYLRASFFPIDPYSAFYVLFAANLVSHNSVFLYRPKIQNAHDEHFRIYPLLYLPVFTFWVSAAK